ncbi:MAG: ABC transporter permease [Verrucomicrobia bacterium]|nr:ABC transporter permease [Verrucomicrobiota bacterium]
MNDLKFAFRQLLKNPGFTAVAVLTLALGIGATTAIVSIVQTAVLDPLPVRHPERLLHFGVVHKERGWSPGINALALRDARRQTNLFARLAAYGFDGLSLPAEDFPQPAVGAWVTSEFFNLWNLRPLLGRTFSADEGKPGQDDVLVISHRFWQRQFGGDPSIVGRAVAFRERPMTVVGVMPPHFAFPTTHEQYWRPAQIPEPAENDILPNTRVVAELWPGIELTQAQAFLDVVTQRQAQEFSQGQVTFSFQARDLREMFGTPEVRRTLGLLLGTVAFVLLIAAANVANLQLARTESRQQELAVRAALGAGRGRVFRQLFTESLLLAVLGGASGLIVTAFGLELLQKLIPPELPRLKPIALDPSALGIACAVTLATGLLFGLAPAWPARRSNMSDVLKLGAPTSTRDRARGRFSRGLVMGQVALALVLLTGAGLMVRSVIGLLRVNPGFQPRNVVRVFPSLWDAFSRHLPDIGKALDAKFAVLAEAQQRIAAIPGVTGVGVACELHGALVEVSAAPGSPGVRLKKSWLGVEESDPLIVLRVPLTQGRGLNRSDVGKGVRRVLVNETAARQLWPGDEAVGKRFWHKEHEEEAAYEVVGVVGDVREYRYDVAAQPRFYRALEKAPGIEIAEASLVVRTAVSPEAFYKAIGQALKAAGGDSRMPRFFNLQDVLRAGMAGHQTVMLYLTIFAAVGLVLAAIGLYGVLAYSVARRTREIGIRIALGAQITDVMRLILGQGLGFVAVGGLIGTAAALATGRIVRAYNFGVSQPDFSHLLVNYGQTDLRLYGFGVSFSDPRTFVAVGLLLAAVALVACWLPAQRAARVDPMKALRSE